MNSSIGLWLFLAIVFFWLTGLYNRLMRLRARAIEVHAELETQVAHFANALSDHDESLPLRSDLLSLAEKEGVAAWREVMFSVSAVNLAWSSSHKKALSGLDSRRRAGSWSELQTTWDHFLAIPSSETVVVLPIELLSLLQASRQKAHSIQEAMNAIVENYNSALKEYPARCVGRMMGFTPGEKI